MNIINLMDNSINVQKYVNNININKINIKEYFNVYLYVQRINLILTQTIFVDKVVK